MKCATAWALNTRTVHTNLDELQQLRMLNNIKIIQRINETRKHETHKHAPRLLSPSNLRHLI